MGSMFSRAEQEMRHPKQRSKRRPHRNYSKDPRRYRGQNSRTGALPSNLSRSRGLRASTADYAPDSPSMTPPEIWRTRSGPRFATLMPVYEHQRSGVPRSRYESRPGYDNDPCFGHSISDVWGGPMPYAPLPPTWDGRFYAGVPRNSDKEVVRESLRGKFAHPMERHKRGLHPRDMHRSKIFIDIDDPFWRGVRVNLIGADPTPRKKPPSIVLERTMRSGRQDVRHPYRWGKR